MSPFLQTLGDEKSSSAYASPTVADIDADGELDIIVGTAEGKLHIFNAKLGCVSSRSVAIGTWLWEFPS